MCGVGMEFPNALPTPAVALWTPVPAMRRPSELLNEAE